MMDGATKKLVDLICLQNIYVQTHVDCKAANIALQKKSNIDFCLHRLQLSFQER